MNNYEFGPWNRSPRILGPKIGCLLGPIIGCLLGPKIGCLLGPKIAFYWELLYKKPLMGGVVDMALYDVGSRRLYP